MSIIEIAVRELQPGDKVVNKGQEVYTVIETLRDEPDATPLAEFLLRIQWADGGYDIRAWDGDLLDERIDVLRP